MQTKLINVKLNISFLILSLACFVLFYSNQIKAQQLPTAIYNTGEAAEDLVDFAQAGNWKEIKIKINTIDDLYKAYRSEVLSNKLSSQLLDFYSMYIEQLNSSLKSKNSKDIAFAANQITGIGVDFSSHFKQKIPAEIGRLDYLGRELLLEAHDNNLTAIDRRLGDVDYTWQSIKPDILAHHGVKQAAVFEKLVSEIKSLKNKPVSSEYNKFVNKYSDHIDKLEKLF